MKKRLLLLSFFAFSVFAASAQDTTKTDPPLTISGSVDTYYKYDFSGFKAPAGGSIAPGSSNIQTSFANEQNSVSIGMIDLALKKKVGKAAFVGELSFGPRGSYQSLVPGSAGETFNIQNLYVSYDVTDKFNLTGGFMATFIGYEVISPVGNFNYSTSYLFTNGPFQNAGLKATYAFTDKVSLMAGIFNDSWNSYISNVDVSNFGAQLFISPVTGWTAYLNVITGPVSGTEFDLTTAYQITDMFKLGLNAADYKTAHGGNGFSGIALYPQISASKTVAFGIRGEYFKLKNGGPDVKAFTLTSNIKAGPLTIIPEVRLDKASNEQFVKRDLTATKSASQFVLAAVYAF
ncbi:porin [Mucilaginibacter sp. 14171R-50]|uniref:outer membrane beta-barrel protein n=1 Tax=Mucilaginibacter sp. 14171R-50 TaxID=2703789 RepID=UPI00138C8A90|nr:outer membrane beta-barrel protein [Mucilaginibacter sp. 14171R-50]QHS57393.1 porin [Mucilaginibacter sp. 14171R-50]